MMRDGLMPRSKRRQFGNIRKLPSGRYQARYRGPDGQLRPAPVTFERKTDASRWLSLKEAEISKGEWIVPELGSRNSGPTPSSGCVTVC